MDFIDFFGKSSRSASERRALLEKREQQIFQGKKISKTFLDFDYFDNPNNPTGYGGYYYDERFAVSAQRMFAHYSLKTGSKVFELGAAKGFLLAEFQKLSCEVYGQDLSRYAIENCHEGIKGRILFQKAPPLPWRDNYFDLVLIKDTLPHLSLDSIDESIRELIRVSKGNLFFDIECGRTLYEKKALKKWDETHLICESPQWWMLKLKENGYPGDVHFKVLVPEEGLEEEVSLASMENLTN